METICKGFSKKVALFTPGEGYSGFQHLFFYIEAFKSSRTYIFWLKPYDTVSDTTENIGAQIIRQSNRKKTYCEAPSVVWDEDKTRDALTKLSSLSVDKFSIYCEKCCHFFHFIERYLEKTWSKPDSKIGFHRSFEKYSEYLDEILKKKCFGSFSFFERYMETLWRNLKQN